MIMHRQPELEDQVDSANNLRTIDALAAFVAIVGALNWGLVGLFRFDLVAWIFGNMDFGQTSGWTRIIYSVVGVAGLYWLVRLPALLGVGSGRTHRRHVPQT
jgi:uncharacterized membrane protein YuzA (DUF378 family)